MDLGTSAFKCAAVSETGFESSIVTASYRLERNGAQVTCPPGRYRAAAWKALRLAASRTDPLTTTIVAVSLTSQAQTFLCLNSDGNPEGDAVVWLDSSAELEASIAAQALPEYSMQAGFGMPSCQQFLPKVMRHSAHRAAGNRYLLLNEWIAFELTGTAFGDSNQQAMGGFWDLRRGSWNWDALRLAGISPQQLAQVRGPGELQFPLSDAAARQLNIAPVPVFSAGNDQTTAALGAGLQHPGDILCNLGTASVVYALREHPPYRLCHDEISGRYPVEGLWYHLKFAEAPREPLQLAESVAGMLRGVLGDWEMPPRILISGGRYRSPEVRHALQAQLGTNLVRLRFEQPGLLGCAKLAFTKLGGGNGTSL